MKTIITAVALLVLTAAVPAFAQMSDMPMKQYREGHGSMMGMGYEGTGHMGMGHMDMDKLDDMMDTCMEQAEMLGLTDDQLMKMQPLHSEMKKKQIRVRADLQIAKIELMDIVEVKDFDLDKAGAAVKKIEGIRTAHVQDMLKSMKDMRTILTDDQYRKMKKMMFMRMSDHKAG